MPRGIPWDDLSSRLKQEVEDVKVEPFRLFENEKKDRDFLNDAKRIGKRILFGAVCGSLTGAMFGFVEVLRDSKAMTAKKSVASAKIIQHTKLFGGFFALYQGTRMCLELYLPQSKEDNVATAAVLSLAPLVVLRRFRPLFPYGVMLIAIDAFNVLSE